MEWDCVSFYVVIFSGGGPVMGCNWHLNILSCLNWGRYFCMCVSLCWMIYLIFFCWQIFRASLWTLCTC